MPADDPLFPDDVTEPAPEPPPAVLLSAAAPDDPETINVARILAERPDVLRGFYEAFHTGNDKGSKAWSERVGAETPEAYARYWYDHHGKYEGYNQGPTTAQDNVSAERILAERPDVLRGFYEAYYGGGNDLKSAAWGQRVGEATPEAYARYWYEAHGKWEGYSQSEKAQAEAIDVQRLLAERPDVLRAFYEAYYRDNDAKSDAWANRVGDATPEAYAKYWYVTHGRAEGYHQRPPTAEPPPPPAPDPNQPDVADPYLDPWNHPALFPNYPNPGWETGAPAGSHRPPAETETVDAGAEEAVIVVAGAASDADPFGIV